MKFLLRVIAINLMIILSLSCYGQKKQEITFLNGEVRLSGTLVLPKTDAPFPAVIMLHGSGAEERNTKSNRLKRLVKAGYAVLTFDKRGVGKSAGDPEFHRYFNFETLAQDALAAVDFLSSRSDIHQGKIGILAASQSGWVAPLAASKSEKISFMIIISASVSTVAEDRLFERAERLRREGFNEDEIRKVTAMQLVDQGVCTGTHEFEEFQQLWDTNKDQRWFRRVYLGENPTPKDSEWRNWYGTVLNYSAVPYLEKIELPVLWLFGDPKLDRFGPIEDSLKQVSNLKEGGKNYVIKQYMNADHNLNGVKYLDDITNWLTTLN